MRGVQFPVSHDNTPFRRYLSRKQGEFGASFDASDLADQFQPYYGTGVRLKVRLRYGYEEEVTGTIGVTTGWKPTFLLMRRRYALGSSIKLTEADTIVAVKVGTKYILTGRS